MPSVELWMPTTSAPVALAMFWMDWLWKAAVLLMPLT
jgi:hypothetical protein